MLVDAGLIEVTLDTAELVLLSDDGKIMRGENAAGVRVTGNRAFRVQLIGRHLLVAL
jgi:hypothetical protein